MRLEQVVDHYQDRVELIWRSFLLRPEPEPRPMDKFTAYTESWQRPASLEPGLEFNQWSGQFDPPSHSMPAAVAGKIAAGFGPERYRDFHHRTMAAYFTDNRTVSDVEVLADIAGAAGIDREAFLHRWDTDRAELINAVVTEHNEAIGAGINAVPSLVVGERYLVPGAVDVADYHKVVERYLAERAEAGTDGPAA